MVTDDIKRLTRAELQRPDFLALSIMQSAIQHACISLRDAKALAERLHAAQDPWNEPGASWSESKMNHIVALSGGRDSTAMDLRLTIASAK